MGRNLYFREPNLPYIITMDFLRLRKSVRLKGLVYVIWPQFSVGAFRELIVDIWLSGRLILSIEFYVAMNYGNLLYLLSSLIWLCLGLLRLIEGMLLLLLGLWPLLVLLYLGLLKTLKSRVLKQFLWL